MRYDDDRDDNDENLITQHVIFNTLSMKAAYGCSIILLGNEFCIFLDQW